MNANAAPRPDNWHFNPLSPDALRDPYPHYARLREHDPVHWGTPGDPNSAGCWYITGYDDVTALLKDDRFGREVWRVLPTEASDTLTEIDEISRQWMVLRDPPTHTRLRQLVHRVFTPRSVTQLAPHIAAITDTLINNAEARGEMDLIADFAFPLAVITVSQLLGIPPEDRQQFIPWTKALAAVIEFKQGDDVHDAGDRAISELNDYLRAIIAKRKKHPQNDLITALIHSDHDEQPITEAELLGEITQLLFGGNDPVAHLFGNGLLALFRHPAQFEAWRNNPDLAETAVDELMRYDSSVQMTFRYALEDVSFGGKSMKTGDTVALVLGSANRDISQFPDAETLDLTRTPNRHMSLGVGIHYCMGAALARSEGQIAFNRLFERLPELTLATDEIQWNDTVAVRGLKRLQVTF